MTGWEATRQTSESGPIRRPEIDDAENLRLIGTGTLGSDNRMEMRNSHNDD